MVDGGEDKDGEDEVEDVEEFVMAFTQGERGYGDGQHGDGGDNSRDLEIGDEVVHYVFLATGVDEKTDVLLVNL